MSTKTVYAILLLTPFVVSAGEMGTGGEAENETVSEADGASVESVWSEMSEIFGLNWD